MEWMRIHPDFNGSFLFAGNIESGIGRIGIGISSETFPRNMFYFGRLLVCLWHDSSCVCDHLVRIAKRFDSETFDFLRLFILNWIIFSFIFSIFALYFVNKISQKAQNSTVPVDVHLSKKKRKWAHQRSHADVRCNRNADEKEQLRRSNFPIMNRTNSG